MIQGLKVTVPGPELVLLCTQRAEYHRERADQYDTQIESMMVNQIQGMSYTNGDPIKSLQDRKSKHDSEAEEMTFIAAHIAISESYLLGNEDLVKLGIVRSRY
jgi:hypothetical protein